MSTRTVIVVAVVACCVVFAVGILIGHFAIDQAGDEGNKDYLKDTRCEGTTYSADMETYKNKYLDRCIQNTCNQATCNTEDLPRTYLAYHLNGKTITIDGRLDDEAWQEVPWTDTFMDIRGPAFPAPYFDTKVKVRWNDDRLYIGAWMQETDFWGNLTEDESLVWTQNAFEVYAVPDGSMHNYKEMQINVLNTTWDLMLRKAYIDNRCGNDSDVVDSPWSSHVQKATYTDGGINDPNRKGTYWSAEWSFTFEALANHTTRTSNRPDDQEAWFFIFARPEYKFKIVGGQYEKDDSRPTEWWSWQPLYTVNLHIPSRFGLVQFKRNFNDKTFAYDRWHLYRALFEVFEAEHRYKSVNGMFIDDVTLLDVAPKILSSNCVTITIQLTDDDFDISAKSKINPSLPTGHIRSDRYVTFQ